MTAHALTIRFAEEADAAELAAMSRDLVEAGLGWKYDAARLRRAIRDAQTSVILATEGPRIDGFAIMQFGESRAHLVLLAVRPSRRRSGVGRQLVTWLLESARTAGIESAHLELRAGNHAARRFYRALGFSETILVPGYYGGKEAALRMLRMLRTGTPSAFTWQPPRWPTS